MTQTKTTSKYGRDWFVADDKATVWISDGETRNAARFSPRASDETIVREYLSTYGYTDPEELFGRWNEGWLSRDGGNSNKHFYWQLTGRRVARGGSSGHEYVLRLSRPPVGDLRVDGYRY